MADKTETENETAPRRVEAEDSAPWLEADAASRRGCGRGDRGRRAADAEPVAEEEPVVEETALEEPARRSLSPRSRRLRSRGEEPAAEEAVAEEPVAEEPAG